MTINAAADAAHYQSDRRRGVRGPAVQRTLPLLSIVEKFIAQIRLVDSESKAVEVLQQACERLHARSAVLLEFAPDVSSIARLIDTDPVRRAAWVQYFRTFGPERHLETIRRLRGEVVTLEDRPLDPREPFTGFATQHDLVEGLAVPITHAGDVAGLVCFSGGRLDDMQQQALLMICYALFSRLRSLPGQDGVAQSPLTRRELEVMQLSADGLTSAQIAVQLGISARTVNQHVDNVVNKLGTRNRAHSIAELIRSAQLT